MKSPDNIKDLIVIGAGASGLMAARDLSATGMHITILEARRRIGGRIYTIMDPLFKQPVEGGAEFLHGKPKATRKLLKEYHLDTKPAKGQIWHVQNHVVQQEKDIVTEHHHLLKKELRALKQDLPLLKFLDRHFKGSEYESMRDDVIGFAEGYESASAEKFSTFAFREDWLEAEKWKQHRVTNGYGALIDALATSCVQGGCDIKLDSVVKSITWKKGLAQVKTNDKLYTAKKALITVPLGVLQQNKIQFSPVISSKQKIWQTLGYGGVIKILLQFKTPFWKQKKIVDRMGHDPDKLFFLFSDETIPTWWTQAPGDNSLLTGWLSGPEADKRSSKSDRAILAEALQSLSSIFKVDKEFLQARLKSSKVVNWIKDPYACGSYSYATVNGEKHIELASKPVAGTIFFAGEYLADPLGTVESALKSGQMAAGQIYQQKFL